MKPNIGITETNLESVASVLTTVLANEMVLYTKTRKYHWNVSGESFMEYHKLFEEQYEQLEESIDEVAERIGKLGSQTIGSLQEFLEHSTLKESVGKNPSSKEMIKELLADHEELIITLRKDVDLCAEQFQDAGTADFLTGLMEQHETITWTLRRYLS
ncbi:starvation-inducible DNA-binding protein [Pseudarcicella hirudinis]|uniref:Starvation-inducible DNA-binding protein n=1 Tax=Pseudarcicella hirudinis TaxID=1079859 RepID=A0A1I5XEF6_9BACT|nr:DNA starvation/stationary phase protection protein [Pseudarcicella hirudinis]SFQ30341.1 starvation-inducible DNA-binding protein [Pseudarcicella hirudinis]